MHKKRWTIVGLIIVLILAIGGGGYWYVSHAAAKKIPGNTFRYQSVSKDKTLYVTFATTGDKAVVNPDRNTALTAANSQADFDKAYAAQSKDATWNYSVSANSLTLAKADKDGQVSQWQYNGILTLGKKLTSHSFTYQIAKAGQGQAKTKTTFEQIN
ncbi:hypothetical protein ACFQ5J_09335 [Lacticaseibacillus baoqingensis]|uniref:Extracellular protein n=1 Tax=Lacticaseibacillus baoqingensis TaxID=2486013 RepID=A0ABW4E8K7_9LACO|nr:hypothetical protein [Lacticaseibacillus baoqingensis]